MYPTTTVFLNQAGLYMGRKSSVPFPTILLISATKNRYGENVEILHKVSFGVLVDFVVKLVDT